MSEIMWIRSHVEQLLAREWDVCRVTADRDGDVPFRHGTAMCWVSVTETDPVLVRVFAHAAYGVRQSAKLLRELNEIQRRAASARVDLCDDIVVVSQTISPVGVTGPVLAQALAAVTSLADDIGALVALMFDGSTPFPADATTSGGPTTGASDSGAPGSEEDAA